MGKKKRRGVTLFELLRKDQGQPVTVTGKPAAAAPQQLPSAPTPSVPPATAEATEPTAVETQEEPPRLQVEEDGYVLHLSRQSIIAIAAGAIVLLVVILLIGGRVFRSDNSRPSQQVAKTDADGEMSQPLDSLAPAAGSENVTPDSPVRLPLGSAAKSNEPAEPEQDPAGAPAKPMIVIDIGPKASAAAVTEGDTRKSGLNYLVIQIVPADAKPSPHEDANEIRKFLLSKGIRTIAVPVSSGGIKVLSEQGFDLNDAAEKDKCEKLAEKVRQVGKEYASPKYRGRYNFASPYREKYQK